MDGLSQDVFIERSCEVAIQQLVVIDGLCYHAADEFEVVEMVGVDMGTRVGLVRHSVSRRRGEQGVVGVKHVPSDDDVELSQEAPCILPLLPLELDIEVPLEVLRGTAMQLPESILKDVFPPQVDDNVLSPEAVFNQLQLVTEVASFDVKVEDPGVVDEHLERSLGEGDGALTENLVQHCPVSICV